MTLGQWNDSLRGPESTLGKRCPMQYATQFLRSILHHSGWMQMAHWPNGRF